MKRIISVLIAVFMLLLSISVAAQGAPEADAQRNWTEGKVITSSDYKVVAENDNIALSVKGSTATFTVTNKKSGKVWYSNPELTKEEIQEVKLGLGKINSQISITYLTAERIDGSVNSNTSSRTVTEYLVNGKCEGFVVTYDFDKEVLQIKIPIAYTITETGIKAEILFDLIEENGTSTLSSIELLPMFGAARAEDDGYLFIPDGSGAIIEYSGMYDCFPDYQEEVYGADSSVDLDLRMLSKSEGVRMPVFGAKVGSDAYFAIISSGDAVAKINATNSKSSYSLASVWPSFYYRELDEVGLMSKDSVSRAVRLTDPQIAAENPIVQYNLLSGEDANYSGMAELYRDYLVDTYELQRLGSQNVAPVLQAFGKTYSEESFFGIPIDKAVAATTLEDVSSMYESLKAQGVNSPKFFLYGFHKGGYQNKYVSKFGVDGKLGGKSDLKSLINTVGSGNVYMAYDLLHDYNYSGLFADSKYVAALNKITILKQNGMISTGAWKGTISWKLIANKALLKYGSKLVDSFDSDLGCGIVFENMGTEVYNDFDEKNHADRDEYVNTYMQLNKAASDKGLNVGSDGANIYMVASADIMNEVPLTSSNDLLFTKSVPFYYMVLHGYANISSKPLNGVADVDASVAMCAQFGIMPTYRVTAVESSELKNSNLNFLYNTGFSHWEKAIAEDYALINSISEGLSDKVIVSHNYIGTLSVTEYENGVKIVYNESATETVDFEGKSIAPRTVVRF